MAENPEPPPRQFVNAQTGLLTEQAFRWLEGFRVTNSTDIGSVLSGVAQAQAAADTAQATANAASQTAQAAPGNAFAVALDTPFVQYLNNGVGTQTTNAVTATPSGGTGPYTYAWTYVSGDTFTVNSPAAASTTFSRSLAVDDTFAGEYRVTVTDSLAATASAVVAVSIIYLNITG